MPIDAIVRLLVLVVAVVVVLRSKRNPPGWLITAMLVAVPLGWFFEATDRLTLDDVVKNAIVGMLLVWAAWAWLQQVDDEG